MNQVAAQPRESSDAALARLDDLLLGGPRALTLEQAAAAAGVTVQEATAFWLALGLRLPDPDEPEFTAADVEVIGGFVGAANEFGLSREAGVSLVRAVGHSVDRLATWQTETIVEHLAAKYGLRDPEARLLLIERLPVINGLLERGLVHAWRRDLAAVAHRATATAMAALPQDDSDELPLARAVGLADVAGFTGRTAGLGAAAFADYIQAFEASARDAVTEHGGRVIKTVGDALLFVADDPPTGARVALGLMRSFRPESDAPLRIGLAWGRVLSRFGDIFGPTVALASRLSDEAAPGRVLVDDATAALLPGFVTEPHEVCELPGFGRLRPYQLVAEA